jgi:hypothetical protein
VQLSKTHLVTLSTIEQQGPVSKLSARFFTKFDLFSLKMVTITMLLLKNGNVFPKIAEIFIMTLTPGNFF